MGINYLNIKHFADRRNTPVQGSRLSFDASDVHEKLDPILATNNWAFVGDADTSCVHGESPRIQEAQHRKVMVKLARGAP